MPALPLSALVRRTLDDALLARLNATSPGTALASAVRALCAAARASGFAPEPLLVALKETWESLPELRALPTGPDRQRLVEWIVSQCIEEYYGETQ